MAAVKMKIVYLDGRTEQVVASPRAQVMTEQHFGGIDERNKVAASYYMAWVSLSRAGKEPADFDAWLDLIDDAETLDEEKLDPTQSAQPSDTSSS